MAKQYQNIQKFLDMEALEVPADNSLFFVESMNDKMEERIGEAIQKEEQLTAKMSEIVQLNETIKQLRESVAEKDAALTEKDNTIATLNEQVENLNGQITNLNNDTEGKDNALTEKDNQIAQLNEQIETLNQTVAEKDAEIAALGNKVPAAPAAPAAKPEGTEEQNEEYAAHNVTHAGMTLKEETEAINARMAFLNGQS
jgi:chromosome segregation ATPase